MNIVELTEFENNLSNKQINAANIEKVFDCIIASREFDMDLDLVGYIIYKSLNITVNEFLTIEFFNNARDNFNFPVDYLTKIIKSIIELRVVSMNFNPIWDINNLLDANGTFIGLKSKSLYRNAIKCTIKHNIKDKNIDKLLQEYHNNLSKYAPTVSRSYAVICISTIILYTGNWRMIRDNIPTFAKLL